MKRFLLLFLFLNYCFAFSQQTTGSKYSVKKSTLTSVGSSNIYFSNKKLSVLQSSGQSSIIGTRKIESTTIQQGFLNSTLYLKINNSSNNFIREELRFVISPNPFKDHIQINFSKKTKHDIYIKIYDVNGKTFINNKFKATDKITVPLKRFSIGTYLIKIESGGNSSTKKILKIE
jgi:hypothetical protein